MMKLKNINKHRQARGFNLIELLVSLVVVAVSLFAVAKIQITGMQGVEGAKQSTTSTVGVVNIIERLSIPEHRDGLRTLISADSHHEFKTSGTLDEFNDKYGSLDCNNVPSQAEATNRDVAERAIHCEIGGWIESIKNAFNIASESDLCMNIYVRDVSDSSHGFSYRNSDDGTFAYRIPRITVEYKWKKVDAGSEDDFCTLENNFLKKPTINYSTTEHEYADANIGFSSMEYILP